MRLIIVLHVTPDETTGGDLLRILHSESLKQQVIQIECSERYLVRDEKNHTVGSIELTKD